MNEYSKKIHNQAAEVGRELLQKIVENKELFVLDIIETAEEQRKAEEETTDFANSIIQYLATKNIPARYASMGVEKIIESLNGLKVFIDGTLNRYEDEYLSIAWGIRNDEGKYRREVATVADIVTKLDELKKEKNFVNTDFYNEVAPTMSTEETETAPIPQSVIDEENALADNPVQVADTTDSVV